MTTGSTMITELDLHLFMRITLCYVLSVLVSVIGVDLNILDVLPLCKVRFQIKVR